MCKWAQTSPTMPKQKPNEHERNQPARTKAEWAQMEAGWAQMNPNERKRKPNEGRWSWMGAAQTNGGMSTNKCEGVEWQQHHQQGWAARKSTLKRYNILFRVESTIGDIVNGREQCSKLWVKHPNCIVNPIGWLLCPHGKNNNWSGWEAELAGPEIEPPTLW